MTSTNPIRRRAEAALAAALAVAFLSVPVPARASASLAGVRFAPRLSAGENVALRLHGVALLRYRAVIKAYVAALYLGEGVAPDRVLDDVPRRLEIEYFWPIAAGDFATATREGIARNLGAAELASLDARIARFSAFYRDVRPGDRYALTYVPGGGTELTWNGEPLGRVEGADFAAAIFSIWLGEAPLDASLKAQLLGRS